jgi:UDP-glucose:glycoprotein glucosyltransferase
MRDVTVNTTSSRPFPRPKVLTFDHIYPPSSHTLERPARTAILYASLLSSNFLDLHNFLLSLANLPVSPVEYVFRHVPPVARNGSERNYLTGYGVSMDLKKMDYLALDDRHSGSQGICRISADRSITLLFMPHLSASGKTSSSEAEKDVLEDPIISLVQAYPENTTTHDAASPLTESELRGKCHHFVLTNSLTKSPFRNWIPGHTTCLRFLLSIAYPHPPFSKLPQVRDGYRKACGGK